MTTAYWCVLAAALMPYAFAGIAKFGDRRYDNRAPREFLASLDGRQKRATGLSRTASRLSQPSQQR